MSSSSYVLYVSELYVSGSFVKVLQEAIELIFVHQYYNLVVLVGPYIACRILGQFL